MKHLAHLLVAVAVTPCCYGLNNLTNSVPNALDNLYSAGFKMKPDPGMLEVYKETIQANTSSPYAWGFYVFRTTYRDQDLWDKYMAYIHEHASQYLAKEVYGPEILEHLRFTPVEDRTRLDGASKEAVRGIFQQMMEDLPEAGDKAKQIPPADAREMVRYEFFIYVDDDCLESFAQLDWQKVEELNPDYGINNFKSFGPDAYIIVVDGDPPGDEAFSIYPEDEMYKPDNPEEEPDNSWMPVECRWLVWFYADLTRSDPEWWDRAWQFCYRGEDEKMRAWREPHWDSVIPGC